MLSLWWEERWVRYLVISLTPIGLIDAIYTVLLWNSYGGAYEFNPLVRFALSTEWWYIWFLVDIVSFSLFAMIAGSYYLHTRSRIFGNRTGWLAVLVGFRVGAAVYNILLFYEYAAPVAAGVFTFIAATALMWRLLRRTDDISKQGFVEYWKLRYDSLRHRYLRSGTGVAAKQAEPATATAAVAPMPESDMRAVWLKRAGYLSVAALVFVTTPYFLMLVSDLTGVGAFSEIFGPFIFWNELSGPGFIMGFGAIVILSAIMMYFILKAFSAAEGTW